MQSATRSARFHCWYASKANIPAIVAEQTCDMRPVQLDQIEGVEEHAGIMPALSDTTERRGGCRASPVRRPCGR